MFCTKHTLVMYSKQALIRFMNNSRKNQNDKNEQNSSEDSFDSESSEDDFSNVDDERHF